MSVGAVYDQRRSNGLGRYAAKPGALDHRLRAVAAPVAALVTVVVSFVATIAYTDCEAKEIDKATLGITGDAAPSIQHLAAARAELRRFQADMADYVNDALLGAPTDRHEVDRARAALDDEVAAFLKLPVYPTERELWQKVAQNLDDLDRIAGRVMALVAAGDTKGANTLADHGLREGIDRTSEAVLAAIETDAQQANELAMTIHEARLHLHRSALALGALSTLLAVLAGVAATVITDRYVSLLRTHGTVLERRADELEQFAGTVAHDVLGPINAMGVAFELLGRRLSGDRSAEATISRGRGCIKRVHSVVDGLLSFARAGAKPEIGARADVRAVIDDAAEELAEPAQTARVERCIEPFEPCAVAASPGVLTSLVSNLMRNAIKYMGEAEVRRVTVRVRKTAALVRVDVEDTGPGIAAKLKDTIFQPYVRGRETGQPGIGLGLATVKRLVEVHCGRVGIESSVGRGSLFWFELPRAASEAEVIEPEGPVQR